jgi:branched-chain amino acid transport system permease protein
MTRILSNKESLFGIHKRISFRENYFFLVMTILLVIFPFLIRDAYIINVLIIALIFSILATSWNLMSGYIGIVSFGHQAFFGIGAYVSSLLAMKVGISPWVGLLFGGIVAALLCLAIGFPCLRLRAAPYIAMTTLAFSEITRITCMNLVNLTRGELGLWGIPDFPDIILPGIGIITFTGRDRILPYYYLILIILIITMVSIYFILNSHIGLAFRSIRNSRDAAESLGINITYYKLLAFFISGFFAGVAGSFYAHYFLLLTPTSVFHVTVMIEVIAFTFIGGLGTFLGPMLGSFILTIGSEYLRVLGEYRLVTYGVILVIMILFIPEGVGKKILKK